MIVERTGRRDLHETSTRNDFPAPQRPVRPGLLDAHEHHPGCRPLGARGAGRGHLRSVRCDGLAADYRHLPGLSRSVERVPDAGAGVCVVADPARFAFLAGELFMAHFVYHGLRGWLLTLGLIFIVGGAANLLTLTQARTLAEENRDIARVLAPVGWVRLALNAVIGVLSLCAWALYDVLRLGQVQLVVALVALVGIIVFIGSSMPYWNQVLAYARGDKATRTL